MRSVAARIPFLAPVVLSVLLVIAAGWIAWCACWPRDEVRLITKSYLAFINSDFESAAAFAEDVLKDNPHEPHAHLLLGMARSRSIGLEAALPCYEDAAAFKSDVAVEALVAAGHACSKLGYGAKAEKYLQQALSQDPANATALDRLIYVLEAQGRSWEARPVLRQLLETGRPSIDQLMMFANYESFYIDDPFFTQNSRTLEASNPLSRLQEARTLRRRNDLAAAQSILVQIIQHHPDCSDAQGELGMILAETGDDGEFLHWRKSLPEVAFQHPTVWLACGLWARKHQSFPAAARCFWEAVQCYPFHTQANYQLSQVLMKLTKPTVAKLFEQRANQLARIDTVMLDAMHDLAAIEELVQLLKHQDRSLEAAHWANVAKTADPSLVWAQDAVQQLSTLLNQDATISQFAGTDPEYLNSLPLPDWTLLRGLPVDQNRGESWDVMSAVVHFEDSAKEVGLQFQYHNGKDPNSGRARMFEFNGGGVAVIDYDGDRWPDVYFTQGRSWPFDRPQQEFADCIFRNCGSRHFQDVTKACGLGDTDFSQGVTVGDFNNDGFQDLYVGNIGLNKLYQNNGDGTFSDITSQAGISDASWTSSCVIADFNGDSHPDIYDCNYLSGRQVFEHQCYDQQTPVQCGPILFPAAPDRLLLNQGDGKFQDVSEESGIIDTDGKGLGVVTGDFDGTGRLSLFVANDTTANFFFVNATSASKGPPKFEEHAMLSGVAFDDQGRAQACMGIAIEDLNLDGRLDLFVTNFYREFNALYIQQDSFVFEDAIRKSRLADASYGMMGWGTQPIDVDRDGLLDLILMNGHINDFVGDEIPYRMCPQVFRNQGSEFQELVANSIGSFFQQERLGRSLARLDWNRDGLEDFCCTSIDTPAALVTNQTRNAGHYIALRLVGTATARDAIGTRIRIQAGGKTYHRQLTAGDGFQASNERIIIQGLGAAPNISEFVIYWPSGEVSSFTDLDADCELIFVEGAHKCFRSR